MLRRTVILLVVVLLAPPELLSAQSASAGLTSQILEGLRARSIGPAVAGGRIHEIEALGSDPSTIYVATASGGIWKTTNKGITWTPIFDKQGTSTFGDVAIAPSNPQVVYAGTGEQNQRQSSSWGDGVYRSTDGGSTWTHVGLTNTRHIGKIQVHPTNPDVAYVAALGNLWAPSTDRGVFKTTDGGRTWEKVLYVDTLTGAVDVAMHPADPNTLFAATYQRLRQPWGFNGGGPGSGIHKTTDGGRTWRRITNGLPPGEKGRIGLAISRSNPRVLNAIIEAPSAWEGVYRSEDGGETWSKMSSLNPRPSYYSKIFIDPLNDERVYVMSGSHRSEDGGRTWSEFGSAPTYDVGVHGDHQALWIDPNDTRHLYLGNDGGLYETWDRGLYFRKLDKLAIAQFYAIGVDMRDPYFVYGGLQDNHRWMGPSATRNWSGILEGDWTQIEFGDGMFQQPDPTNHRYIYSNRSGSSLHRVDAETGDIFTINPTPAGGEEAYRFDWATPMLLSQHDPRVVYTGGNRLFISRDRGLSWERTEDLTRRIDANMRAIMGVPGSLASCGRWRETGREEGPPTGPCILSKNDGTSSFSEITAIAESPVDRNVLWIGVDDGNIQVSRDGGRSWTEVSRNVRGIRDGTYVSRIIGSVTGAGVAYATFDDHRVGDFAPYVFRTRDFGQSWQPLMNGLPTGSVNVIREHPQNPNLLFLGTEHALFVSADAGANSVKFGGSLPTTLYDDLVIHPRDNDLVIGTHGRSIWIVDDLTPLVEWSATVASAAAHLFTVQPATIFNFRKNESYQGNDEFIGENPPFGALISYYLGRNAPSVRITVANRQGTVVRTLQAPTSAGLHRVAWDLRHEPPPYGGQSGGGEEGVGQEADTVAARHVLPHPITPQGPFVAPGTYRVTLEAGSTRFTEEVLVKPDPLMPMISQQDYEARERFLVELQALQRRAADAVLSAQGGTRQRISQLRDQLDVLANEFNGDAVRPGSLYPPGPDHQRRRADLERSLTQVLAGGER